MTKAQLNCLHTPVMVQEILEFAQPVLSQPQTSYLDATFGRGGHFEVIWSYFGNQLSSVLLWDQDLEAIDYGKKKYHNLIETKKIQFVQKNFSEYDPKEYGYFDFILLDLGVSSPQLETAQRGFSFYLDGPLDMRMNLNNKLTAYDVINHYQESKLIEIFKNYGEIRSPYKVVKAIIHDRKTKPFKTTRDLASLIERIEGWSYKGRHPATLYFQAIRIEVNQELDHIKLGLPQLISGLKPQGRIAVLTFHSLEDRIVKWAFKQDFKNLGYPLTKKVIEPTHEEMKNNPRARSAKLRVFERM